MKKYQFDSINPINLESTFLSNLINHYIFMMSHKGFCSVDELIFIKTKVNVLIIKTDEFMSISINKLLMNHIRKL